jgi:hypothetical protein
MIENFCDDHGNFDGLLCPECCSGSPPLNPKPIPYIWCAFSKTPCFGDVFQAIDLEGNTILLKRIA